MARSLQQLCSNDDRGGGGQAAAPCTLPPGHDMCQPASCALALFLVLALCVVPACVLVAVETSHAYLLLFLAEALLALSALEWSWLAFRIRRKILFTLRTSSSSFEADRLHRVSDERIHHRDATNPTDRQARASSSSSSHSVTTGPNPRSSSVEPDSKPAPSLYLQRQHAMRTSAFAVRDIADRFCRGQWAIVAVVAATIAACAVLAGVYGMEHAVFRSSQRPIGWHMLIAVTTSGTFLAVLAGSIAPTKVDGFAIVVAMSCFMASSMNSFLMYYAKAIGKTELLDPLFITLVGACTMFVTRVVTSAYVMESLVLVLCDTMELLALAAPMLAAADFVDHPGAALNRDKLALFFLVVFAAETGDWVMRQLASRSAYASLPLCRRACDDPPSLSSVLKGPSASRSELSAFIGAVAFGALMLPASLVWEPQHQSLGLAEALVLLLALVLGQLSRFFLASMKDVAEVSTTGFYLPRDARIGGVLDRLAVFLVAAIVYHPYFKHVVYQ